MGSMDRRFALLRGDVEWFACPIEDRSTGEIAYRISERGATRDAHGQAERVKDIEVVARRVILEGKRMRCAAEGVPPSSLDLASRGVTGYRLDPAIAAALGVPAEGTGSTPRS
jgi:hypothetical protein